MPTNPYFNTANRTSEQNLVEDLIVEAIQIYGHDVVYLPRTLMNEDVLYGEDPISKFSSHYNIEVYVKNVDGFEGQGDFLSKFGLQIQDQATFVVSKARFERILDPVRERPTEGDLIYFPLTERLYEIVFVEHEPVFYQTGKLHSYEFNVEKFSYSHEDFETGDPDIDQVENDYGYSINLNMSAGGSGDYSIAESIYQGASLATATASAEVIAWSDSTRELKIKNIVGEFTLTENVVGDTSGATWELESYDDQEFQNDDFAENDTIETQADSIIDFSENDPFSEGNGSDEY